MEGVFYKIVNAYNFQVLYGVDTDGDGVANRVATASEIDELDDTLLLEGANAVERARDRMRKTFWKKVVLVKVALLVRGSRNAQSDTENAHYDLFGPDYAATHASADPGTTLQAASLGRTVRNRMRKMFSTVVQLRNPSSGSAT